MNELTKTMTIGGVAIASMLLAWATRPVPVSMGQRQDVNRVLYPDFKDPLKANSLKIVRFDEAVSKTNEIEVRKNSGVWTLPTHGGYPADAENRVRDATTPFVDLKSLSIATEKESEYPLYGVVEPNTDKANVGASGVGTLITIKDESGNNLVNMIVGKEVKGQPGLRYVRQPGQIPVYVAKVDPTRLPVRFDDWIEKDLLKLNAWDISQMVLKDYTFQVATTLRGPVTDYDQRLEVTINDNNGQWALDKMLVASGKDLAESKLADEEELNQERLNGLKDALDKLEIVNVERKPVGLGQDLRTDKGFFSDQAGVDSLLQRGFYPVQVGRNDTDVELLSSDGEVLVRTKEGVEYTLRFGRVQGVEADSKEGKLNRYLLVSARLNEAQFPEPVLETLPETIEDLDKAKAPAVTAPVAPPTTPPTTEPDGGSAPLPAEESNTEAAPAEETAPEAPATDPPAAPDAAPGSEAPTGDPQPNDSSQVTDSSATRFVAVQDPSAPGDSTAPAATPPATTEPAATSPTNPTNSAVPPAAANAQDPAKRLQAERERITRENQRKIDERKDKIAKAQKKVRELNYRFADWYYVISEDVYKKVHLGQADIVKLKSTAAQDAKDSGAGIDALRQLQQDAPSLNPDETPQP